MLSESYAALRSHLLSKVVPARDDTVLWRGVRYLVLSPTRGLALPPSVAQNTRDAASLLCLTPTGRQILIPLAEVTPVAVDPGHVLDVLLEELHRSGVI